VVRTGATSARPLWLGRLGYYTDPEIGSAWVRERAFAPAIARWLSNDPIIFRDGRSRYGYSHNSPAFVVDPSGMAPQDIFHCCCGYQRTKPPRRPRFAKYGSYWSATPIASNQECQDICEHHVMGGESLVFWYPIGADDKCEPLAPGAEPPELPPYQPPPPLGSRFPPAPQPSRCSVVIECVKLVGIGGVGIAEHCGLKITSPNGAVTRYHVPGGLTCTLVASPTQIGGISGSYFDRDKFNVDPAICDCIAADASRLQAANLPYSPIPSNNPCGGDPTCNSNYTTKCLLSHCGLQSTLDSAWFPPVGWGHRMKKCVRVARTKQGCCVCVKWDPTDDAWCSPRTQADTIADPTG
jgi:RHS repeat-associated protein